MLFDHIYNDPEASEELKEQARDAEKQIVEVFVELAKLGYPQEKLSCRLDEDDEGPMLIFLCDGMDIPHNLPYEQFLAAKELSGNDPAAYTEGS